MFNYCSGVLCSLMIINNYSTNVRQIEARSNGALALLNGRFPPQKGFTPFDRRKKGVVISKLFVTVFADKPM
jgi:hypothetical protein